VVYWSLNLPAHASRSNIRTHITWRLMPIKRFVIRKGRWWNRWTRFWVMIPDIPPTEILIAQMPGNASHCRDRRAVPDPADALENRSLTTVRRRPYW
jgi:hypothetical protein